MGQVEYDAAKAWIKTDAKKPRKSIVKQVLAAVPALTAEEARRALRMARLENPIAVRRFSK
ncbi:hypothetical protein [Mesorhizobium sp. M2C.T.Ca.TU.002.02.1.1]|uniref:hypothetical protein n=1 Tax=Mesorhizobium sp. M2C.T.Ca.TU.002.02.1.1 TaxID=2496788 RepID=UPI000FCAD5F3|nr:hypothetical protein [Mesorhizobium sp. M2C.T.Ca.TU.002.02.1.1]RUU59450.1 hypothetical protein EOD07_07090 [Mesorhizobium sp. M2C.T.Ca.TU.002.02.1.1]RUU71596.1 hypothetical protein EOD04_02225 [Mesorhizobium sp. M2C.T.Ca.TU.009.01.2.1]